MLFHCDDEFGVGWLCLCDFDYGLGERSCYDEGKRTAETLAMDYHRGAGVEVHCYILVFSVVLLSMLI